MFEPIEETFDMQFYILAENSHQWPEMQNATICEGSNKEIFKLIASETNIMDVLIITISTAKIPLTYINKLKSKFRIVLNLHCNHDYLIDFQDTVSELCWASYYSHNFDILDASNLLNRNTAIIPANSGMIESGWRSESPVDNAILFLHHSNKTSSDDVEIYIEQAREAFNLESIAIVSFGSDRRRDACNYSVLAQ